jgi:hypothetical protein
MQPRLPCGAEQLFPTELCLNLLVRYGPASFTICFTVGDSSHHVEVIEDVVQTAVVRQAVQESPNAVLGCHDTSMEGRMPSV